MWWVPARQNQELVTLADRKAQDGDGLWAPFLPGAEASGSVLAQGASHRSGSTARWSCVKVSTMSFLPASDKAHDTSLFQISNDGLFLGLPWGIELNYTSHGRFPTWWLAWAWGETSPSLQHFRRLLQDPPVAQAALSVCSLPAVSAVWLPKDGII